MRILWLTWKDTGHPQAGGAEVVNEELAKRLAKEGHDVTFLVGGHKSCKPKERRDGFEIIRIGGRFSVYRHARSYYKKHLRGWADLVIDEVNTIPFFAKFYVKEPSVLFVHQLAREIWFYQMPFPVSLVGYLLEPLYLRLLATHSPDRPTTVITVSESTKADLIRHGFKAENVHIISEGIELKPVPTLAKSEKYERPTLLSLGAIRPMKRTLEIVKAFEIIKSQSPTPVIPARGEIKHPSSQLDTRSLRLIIAGDTIGGYGKKVLRYIEQSPYRIDIEVLGRVSKEEKIELMQKSHAIAVTSVKEGWGLIVTEANSQGTPAVVYNVDGLRDSVRDGETGMVTKENTPESLADSIVSLLGHSDAHPPAYPSLRIAAWEWSKEITFDRSYSDFKRILRL